MTIRILNQQCELGLSEAIRILSLKCRSAETIRILDF